MKSIEFEGGVPGFAGREDFGLRGTHVRTVGGWYISGPSLKNQLVRLGLPETPPAGNGFDAPWPILAFAAFAATGATVIVAVRIRRRPRPATA